MFRFLGGFESYKPCKQVSNDKLIQTCLQKGVPQMCWNSRHCFYSVVSPKHKGSRLIWFCISFNYCNIPNRWLSVPKVYDLLCNNPSDIQCRTLYDDVPSYQTGQILDINCTVSTGLDCRGASQSIEDGRSCYDYEVRHSCPECE